MTGLLTSDVPALECTAVSLRPYALEHVEDTVAWLGQARIRETFGISHTITRQGHLDWLAAQHNLYLWAICTADAGYVGNVSLRRETRHRQGYFEIYLGRDDQWGRGLGRASLQLVLDFAFGQLDLHRVYLYTLADNRAAEKLYHNAGFQLEGELRECVLRDGSFYNQRIWSLLASEWDPGRDRR